MKTALAVAATLLALSSFGESVSQDEPRPIYCNITLSDACWGIDQGDEALMRVRGDFISYDVTLSSGAHATIYYGYQPEIDVSDRRLVPCPVSNGFGECRILKDRFGVSQFLARRDDHAHYVHVVIDKRGQSQAVIDRFLRGFHACRMVHGSTTCAE